MLDGGVSKLSEVELKDEGGEGSTVKKKEGGTPEGWMFLTPFWPSSHFFLSIAGESESWVCNFW